MTSKFEAVLTSTHNLCFEQKYEKYQSFLSENFQCLEVKFSVLLNGRVFVMSLCNMRTENVQIRLVPVQNYWIECINARTTISLMLKRI